jgi:chromosome segregation ATPase
VSKHTQTIKDNQNEIARIGKDYQAVEADIGRVLVTETDFSVFSPEAAGDVKTWEALKAEIAGCEGTIAVIKAQMETQKDSSAKIAALRKTLKEQNSALSAQYEALGLALADSGGDSLGDSGFQGEVSRVREKIAAAEESLGAKRGKGGFFSAIKDTLDRTTRKAGLTSLRDRLKKLLVQGGSAAMQDEGLRELEHKNRLPEAVDRVYRTCAEMYREYTALQTELAEEESRYGAAGEAIKKAGPPSQKLIPGSLKIRNLQAEIRKKTIDETIVLARAGNRYAESVLGEEGGKAEGADFALPKGAENKFQPMLKRLGLLQKDIDRCGRNIEDAQREIRIEELTRSIETIKSQAEGQARRIAKLTEEKNQNEEEIKALSAALEELMAQG